MSDRINGQVSYHQNFDFDSGQIFNEEKDACIPRFYLAEREAGDKIEMREMVEVITPGDRLSRPIFRVNDMHKRRWARQYAAFKSGIEPGVAGTPIASWTDIDWSLRDSLRAAGFQTIEQLSEAHDGQLESIQAGSLLRRKAKMFVDKNKTVAAKDTQLDEMKKQIKELTDMIKANSVAAPIAAPKRKAGRPKRVVPETKAAE